MAYTTDKLGFGGLTKVLKKNIMWMLLLVEKRTDLGAGLLEKSGYLM